MANVPFHILSELHKYHRLIETYHDSLNMQKRE